MSILSADVVGWRGEGSEILIESGKNSSGISSESGNLRVRDGEAASESESTIVDAVQRSASQLSASLE